MVGNSITNHAPGHCSPSGMVNSSRAWCVWLPLTKMHALYHISLICQVISHSGMQLRHSNDYTISPSLSWHETSILYIKSLPANHVAKARVSRGFPIGL